MRLLLVGCLAAVFEDHSEIQALRYSYSTPYLDNDKIGSFQKTALPTVLARTPMREPAELLQHSMPFEVNCL